MNHYTYRCIKCGKPFETRDGEADTCIVCLTPSAIPPPPAPASAIESQVGGSHYKTMAIQPACFAYANKLDFFQGCVVKYICRFREKGGLEDLRKAQHYLALLIELEYPDTQTTTPAKS